MYSRLKTKGQKQHTNTTRASTMSMLNVDIDGIETTATTAAAPPAAAATIGK